MTPEELRDRTLKFAVRVLQFADSLPRTASGRTVSSQVARSGTSVAANYRSALRGKSRADFINKIAIVLEEADETEFWIELAVRSGLVSRPRVTALQREALELTKIFSATRRSSRDQ